jgi:hypothetical protein
MAERGGRGAALNVAQPFPICSGIRALSFLANGPSATTTKRRVRRPLHHAAHGPPPPLPRGRIKQSCSRDASAPEFCQTAKCRMGRAQRNPSTFIKRRWVSLRSTHPPRRNKGGGKPTDAFQMSRTQAACGSRHGAIGLRRPSACGRARLSAFHHGSRQRDFRPQGSASGHASWDVAERSILYARPNLSQPSEHLAPRS